MTSAASVSPAPGMATPAPLLVAPSSWRRVDFIADLHLQPSDEATFGAWQDYMHRTQADALFILGDLFEVWVGDDIVEAEARPAENGPVDQTRALAVRCAEVLRQTSHRLALYFIHGNRDFLLGTHYAQACGMTLLADPSVLEFCNQRWLLSHGDQWCLADTAYMQFRTQVRNTQWCDTFLAKPLLQRQTVARDMRQQSEARKHWTSTQGATMADVDAAAARDALLRTQASTLIHGHTHKPAEHDLGRGLRRLVLSDWDANARPPRASVLRLSVAQTPLAGASLSVERLAASVT